MVIHYHNHIKQEQEWEGVMPIVAADEEKDVHIAAIVRMRAWNDDDDHKWAAVGEELPVAEQDVEEDSDIAGEQVQIQVQEEVQSVGMWGYLESVGHVWSVEPELDAMQRYLEGSGP
jgi:hypothetical protein